MLPGATTPAAATWVNDSIKSTGTSQAVANCRVATSRVALALLHHDVDVLLLDEPTRGIDVASKAQCYALIDGLVSSAQPDDRAPRGVLLVSSYIPELLGLCDRIAVMRRGRLSEPLPVDEWNAHRLMRAATGAEAA